MGTLRRLVENQEQKVTLALTDNLAEHEMLEALLETSKPAADRHPRIARLDYLLQAPWRYPPLPWGSRFGRRFEPSLFYGALCNESLFAEAAYYRFVFLSGMETPFAERVISQFTVYNASYQTSKGYNLALAPFARHESELRHRARYRACQALGSVLRDKGIEAVEYLSARTAEHAFNVALFSPQALRSRKQPATGARGSRDAKPEQVSFRLDDELRVYSRSEFEVDGRIPLPA